jgi:FkbM family methyltransferase
MNLIDRILFKLFKVERTYSQCGEDKILDLLFKRYGKSKIAYLDVGANHPLMNSNTCFFYKQGHSGVCIEPNPYLCDLIRKRRPRDKCLNVGLGEKDGIIDFYLMSSHSLSTFSKEDAERLDSEGKYKIEKVLKIPTRTLNSIVDEYFESPIDLISIDVEGWNEQIIRSIDFTRNRPFCFCVETIEFSEDSNARRLTDIFDVFKKNNYNVYADTHLNTIFVDNN